MRGENRRHCKGKEETDGVLKRGGNHQGVGGDFELTRKKTREHGVGNKIFWEG